MANWLSAPLQFGIGIVHLLLMLRKVKFRVVLQEMNCSTEGPNRAGLQLSSDTEQALDEPRLPLRVPTVRPFDLSRP